MKVKEVMTKKIVTVGAEQSLNEGINKLTKNKVSGLIVLDDYGKLVGVFSEKDAYKAVCFNNEKQELRAEGIKKIKNLLKKETGEINEVKIKSVMCKRIVTIKPEDSIKKAASLMMLKKVNRLPVAKNNKLVGIISRRDIYQAILRKETGI